MTFLAVFCLETQALSSLESSGSGPTCKEGRWNDWVGWFNKFSSDRCPQIRYKYCSYLKWQVLGCDLPQSFDIS